ncbi:hypothetical protein IX315_000905 [Porphyromonas levii]|nr:hypothetical protein [Porphyromonas levii]MBR8759745.1 hypothetical protein [Porphyromonas levii]MBR8765210.1 hypothetical protein [Porphyromonas levii]MBR8770370.1 hypothetical protein [Porphyromonas levii]
MATSVVRSPEAQTIGNVFNDHIGLTGNNFGRIAQKIYTGRAMR